VPPPVPPPVLYTLGHSSRSWPAFLALLREHGIEAVADIRRFPSSRRHPHFGAEALRAGLEGAGIRYRHFPELGGRRSPRPGSPHTGWTTPGFQAYADHMASACFRDAVADLLRWAGGRRTAVMCAEAHWWRCHRRLLADFLVVRGLQVIHLREGRADPHRLTPFLRVEGERLYYDGPPAPAPPPGAGPALRGGQPEPGSP